MNEPIIIPVMVNFFILIYNTPSARSIGLKQRTANIDDHEQEKNPIDCTGAIGAGSRVEPYDRHNHHNDKRQAGYKSSRVYYCLSWTDCLDCPAGYTDSFFVCSGSAAGNTAGCNDFVVFSADAYWIPSFSSHHLGVDCLACL